MNDCFRKNGVALFNRDCLEVLHSFPDESVDLIVTDPPILQHREVTLVIVAVCCKRKSIRTERSLLITTLRLLNMLPSFIAYSKTVAIVT